MKYKYLIKNGFFRKKIEDDYGNPFWKNAKFHFFKSDDPKFVEFEIEINGKRTPRLIAQNGEFELYTREQGLFATKDHKFVNINFESGEISPEFKKLVGDLCVDNDNRVFRLERDGKTTYSDYHVTPDTRQSGYNGRAIVFNEDGKSGLIDEKFNVIIPFNYDSFSYDVLDFVNPKLVAAITDGRADFYLDGRQILSSPMLKSSYIGRSDKDLFYVLEDENTRAVYDIKGGKAKKVGTITEQVEAIKRVEDKVMAVTRSGVFELNGKTKKIFEGNMGEFATDEGGQHVVVVEENGKQGLYSLSKEKMVVKPDYDKVDPVYSSVDKGNYLVSKRDGQKQLWGVVNEKGEEVVPFEYLRPRSDVIVGIERIDGKSVNRIAVTKDGEQHGSYEICTRADDVIKKHGQLRMQYADVNSTSQENHESPRPTLKSEGEKWGIALGVSILFESPVAGAIAMNIMNDEENTNQMLDE